MLHKCSPAGQVTSCLGTFHRIALLQELCAWALDQPGIGRPPLLPPGGECIQAIAVNGSRQGQVWNGGVGRGAEERFKVWWWRVHTGSCGQRGTPGAGLEGMCGVVGRRVGR